MDWVIKCQLLQFLCLFAICLQSINSFQVIVKNDAMKYWFYKAYKVINIPGGQLWTGARTNANFSKTCGTGQNSDDWFISNYINFHEMVPELVFVDIEAEFEMCLGQAGHVSCFSNHFEVYVSRSQVQPNIFPTSATEEFLLSHFYPVYNITNHTSMTALNRGRKQTFTFLQNKSEGVTFGIRSRGACGKIFRMKMYYYYCDEKFINSIKFAKTVSPPNGSKQVSGNCSRNTSPSKYETGPTGLCYRNGTWNKLSGKIKCSCIAGFEPSPKKGCTPCQDNHYKPNDSNLKCKKCLLNNLSVRNKTTCQCKEGFYRLRADAAGLSACYGLLKLKGKPNVSKSNGGNITIRWNKPKENTGLNEIVKYVVECYSCEKNVCNRRCVDEKYDPRPEDLTRTVVIVYNLKPGIEYVFRVYPKNSLNQMFDKKKWNFIATDHVTVTVKKTEKLTSNQSMSYIIIVGVVSVLLLVLAAFLVVFAFRRKRKVKKASISSTGSNGVELLNSHHKMYIDPWNYQRPEDAVFEFASELDPSTVTLEMMIGGGEFGDVHKGSIKLHDGSTIPVAVKTLKPDVNPKSDVSPKSERDFLLEASVMGQFDNPNVIQLQGVITKSNPRMIVTEFMSNGSLDNFLKLKEGMLSQLQLIGMARGVAAGMKYLAGMNYVHRDLAARNILVNDSLLCKVSDFGLSRELETTDSSCGEYATSGGKIPVRWTAPEAIKYRKFSSASDVWSYGILLWEIMSFAKRPYWDWHNYHVIEQVDKGFRLPSPLNCPKGVHHLMLLCWKKNRGERPNFLDITRVIDGWIRSPETIETEVDYSTTLGEWLQSINMRRYVTQFAAAEYEHPSQLFGLKDADLKEMGITLIGHRNKILKGIQTLHAEMSEYEIGREDSMDV